MDDEILKQLAKRKSDAARGRRELPLDVSIHLITDPKGMTDAELAAMVRAAYDGRHDARKAAYDRTSEKLGTPVVIDGIQYPSKSRAMKATGLTFQAIQKRLASPPGDG